MKKKRFLTYFRLAVQILFFILLPGLYVNAYSGVKAIYTGLIYQSFSIKTMWPQLVGTIAVLPATFLFGRFFCGWMCAFGTFGDLLYMLSTKVLGLKFRISEKADSALKYVKYVLLVSIVIVIWTTGTKAFSGSSPWDVFGLLATPGMMPDLSLVLSQLLPGFIIFLAIAIASLFVERFFCRYLCPLGAIFAIGSAIRLPRLKKPSNGCGKCRICTNGCSMGIPLYQNDVVKSGECIYCFKCTTKCPRQNVRLNVANEDLRPVIAGAVTVSVITGMYYAGSLASNNTSAFSFGNIMSAQSVTSQSNKLYKDGTYEGSGRGFRSTTTLNVTVRNDKITDIKVVSVGDDGPFFNAAYQGVASEIISSQSTQVSAVSGATYSSMGIMNAVADALSKAAI